MGSFQEYVRHDFVVEDLSPSLLPSKEVRESRVCVLCVCIEGEVGETWGWGCVLV